MILLKLFWEFFKTGLFAIGGGMATVPFLFNMSAKTGWFTAEQLTNMIAVSESTPGPIGVNMATYVGFTTAGIAGSLISAFGLILPSFLIMIVIAGALSKFRNNPIVDTCFTTLRPAVIGLIAYALYTIVCVSLLQDSEILVIPTIACVLIFVLIKIFRKVHPIIWIALGAVFGIFVL